MHFISSLNDLSEGSHVMFFIYKQVLNFIFENAVVTVDLIGYLNSHLS